MRAPAPPPCASACPLWNVGRCRCAEVSSCCHGASAWPSPALTKQKPWLEGQRGTARSPLFRLRGEVVCPGSPCCVAVGRLWSHRGCCQEPTGGGCGALTPALPPRGGRDGQALFKTLRTAIVLPFLCGEGEGCCLWRFSMALLNQADRF